MDNTRAFLILGIPEGKEEREIKQAYRKKLRFVNPEDNPEGFKELRSAYETALQYAQSKEEEPDGTVTIRRKEVGEPFKADLLAASA